MKYRKVGEWWAHVYSGEDGFAAIYVPSSSEIDPVTDQPKLYTVIVERDGKVQCDCRGFAYRQACRHSTDVSRYLSTPKV